MITQQLIYKLEKREWFPLVQSGFRIGKRTMDAVLALDVDIQKAMAHKEGLVGVFLNIEKANDMLWKEGMVVKIFDAGGRGAC